MRHLDLFSGIGGFALAADWVWPDVEHVFCEIDPFCQAVLRKHWPDAPIYGDIRTLNATAELGPIDLLTGGFPCQPFSEAGRRRGTADDRHLWPEMLRVIRESHPRWIVGENVRGFITWNDGMVLDQVHTDLEGEGYEVQAFVIPAVAVNAPHRRDRVWIIAHTHSERRPQRTNETNPKRRYKPSRSDISEGNHHASYSSRQRDDGRSRTSKAWRDTQDKQEGREARSEDPRRSFDQHWFEAASRFCRVDDGISDRVDRLKSLGNAIVPQVAAEIMKTMKLVDGGGWM